MVSNFFGKAELNEKRIRRKHVRKVKQGCRKPGVSDVPKKAEKNMKWSGVRKAP